MIRSSPLAALVAATAFAAVAQGPIDTVERGRYTCELPGDGNKAIDPQPARNFRILTGSRYSSPQGDGTYLRRGKRLQMTSGPRKGETFEIVHPGFVRSVQGDGTTGRLRCVRYG